MDSNDDFKKIPWDAYSEQPFPIRHRRGLLARARHGYADYLKSALTSAALMPLIAGFQLALSAGYRPKRWKRPSGDIKDFAGLAVGLHSCEGPRLAQEIKKLRVKHLLLRVPVWEMGELHEYVDFVASLPECEFVICVMQTREEVVDLGLWREKLRILVEAFWPRVKSFQIGQGVNRSKWGFFTTEEFLAFASVAEELRQDFKGISLVGPSILDFETIPLVRSLTHGYPIRWDAVGCALYVDRRGSPRNRQMLLFNTTQKILHFAACIRFSNKSERRFWITEVNWPLKDQGEYAPTGEAERVSEEDAGRYLTEYYEDAWNSQLVDRVYWWQLVAKGFGLMEPMDDGTLRPRPAYHAFKEILENGLATDPDTSTRNADPTPNLAADGPNVAARIRRA